ncbi:LCP family protein [Sanguibacter sp. 4.1]|uniref:LCP family protein n=1 Tax=Sanguibacter biliveldensis TaxID=3030830 RepID=A0AAF0Z985_9MICO|nr:LCP family protein [Sanguibacter sp. 4.1]WPF83186.1 LCP family protein [Sanguibacter sp. 4.1]
MTSPDSRTRAARRADASPARRERPAHARPARRHNIGKVVALTLVGVFAFTGTAAGALYYKLDHNIETVDLEALTDESVRPPTAEPDPEDPNGGVALNILLIGSDARNGENAAIGGEAGGMRSDTTMVMHVSADRTRVEVVSIPRDSLVALPSCETTNGTVSAKSNAMFNSAFAAGWDTGGDIESAVSCTRSAVESLTNVRMDGFMVVDFTGFEKMVDAIGGVPLYLDSEINSPMADLYLPAGQQTLNGQQALGLARARKGEGLDGSDLKRIDRQQDLLNAMASTVLSKNLLTDTPALIQFLNSATSSLTVSNEFSSITDLAGLALSLKGVSMDSIVFETVPIMDAPSDKNRVVWTSAAEDVWASMAADVPIPQSETASSTGIQTPGAAEAADTADAPADGTAVVVP